VLPAVTRGRIGGRTGSLPEIVAASGDWSVHDAYLAGPSEMVRDTVAVLAAAGTPASQIHIEDFGWSEP
jgi:ferredoxin-NADP reductase